ncbi:MAG: hypothetical protein V3S30_03485, partial [Thermoanaerobaculia bacterium]
PRTLAATFAAGQPRPLTWSNRGEAVIYAQPLKQASTSGGTVLVRHDVESDRVQALAFMENVVTSVEVLSAGVLVVSTEATSGGLRERALALSSWQDGDWLTHGAGLDRQPVYSPDGERVMFTSDRTGNLDIWEISSIDGALRRLIDHPADDWDPAYSPDGRNLIWSSDRGGHFEIWMAEADGRNPRQVTNDGFDAENPTMTADGEWIVYNTSNPTQGGVWKIRPNGTDATHLWAGLTGLPEVSPDGRYVVFTRQVAQSAAVIRNASVEVISAVDGKKIPFQIDCKGIAATGFNVAMGRSRWMPDGRGIAFVCSDPVAGIFRQDFRPGADTRESRSLLASGDGTNVPESFGISWDGTRITVSEVGILRRIEAVSNLPGVTR